MLKKLIVGFKPTGPWRIVFYMYGSVKKGEDMTSFWSKFNMAKTLLK